MASSFEKDMASSNKMRAARLSGQQFEVLIDFMQQHPHFAVGRASGGSYTKEEHDQLWKTLAAILNETQGPVKPVSKWQKCWVDLKSNARSRANKWRARFSDSPPEPPGSVFTPWDERVLRLLNGISLGNNDSSPLQLVEVGFSEKSVPARSVGASPKAQRLNNHSILSKGYQCNDSDNGSHYDADGGPHDFNMMEALNQADQDGIAEVKSEEEEWLEEENGICEEEYSLDSMTARNDLGSQAMRYLPTHYALPSGNEPEEPSGGDHSVRSKKRKLEDHNNAMNVEDSLERLSKKICGTLDRIATAAEEANTLQQGMVNAMNRLATTFEELLPVVAKVLSKN